MQSTPSTARKRGAQPGSANRAGTGNKPPSSTRSLRLPVATWEALERKARDLGVTVNALAGAVLTEAAAR